MKKGDYVLIISKENYEWKHRCYIGEICRIVGVWTGFEMYQIERFTSDPDAQKIQNVSMASVVRIPENMLCYFPYYQPT